MLARRVILSSIVALALAGYDGGELPLSSVSTAFASGGDPTMTWSEDATQIYYNSRLRLEWENILGDWVDAAGVKQGSTPFASQSVVDTDLEQVIEIDVTSLLVVSAAEIRVNRAGGTNFVFHSRETADPAKRPVLLVTKGGVTTMFAAQADVTMNLSTLRSLGTATTLHTWSGFIVRFAQEADPTITRAVLRLTATTAQYGNQTLNIFRAYAGQVPALDTPPESVPSADRVNFTWTEDATRAYYNGAFRLSWENLLGDWLDAAGVRQGLQSFASIAVVDTNIEQVIAIDVTSMVAAFGADFRVNRVGGTSFAFHSREVTDPAKRPTLRVTKAGITKVLQAEADLSLNRSTSATLGNAATLSTRDGILIRFPQAADATISRAVLRLVATPAQYGNQTLHLFRPNPRPIMPTPPVIALGSESDVVLRAIGPNWTNYLSSADRLRTYLDADGILHGAVPIGESTGASTLISIPPDKRREVMFMRTVIRLEDTFDPDWGGKMPGLSNLRGCGWGGRVADGTCWSARTFFESDPNALPFGRSHLAFGAYAYRYNRQTHNGEGPPFSLAIPRGRFVVVDQRVKLNSIRPDGLAASDGELTYWLNGVAVLHWGGIVWRTHAAPETLPSQAWVNVYVGGSGYMAPYDHEFAIHSVTVSTRLLPFDSSLLDALNGGGG